MGQILELNRFIDHTILKPEATSSDIRRLCQEAIAFNFFSVFVNPGWINLAESLLHKSGIRVGSVVGFPLGANSTEVKIREAEQDLADGAGELDMVMNIGRFKEGDFNFVQKEIVALRKICAKPNILKVIIETGLLSDEEKKKAAILVKDSGADFVKTSTGFGETGATVKDVTLLREAVGPDFKIKASGGIRDCQTALKFIEAGANRIGSAASVKIMEEFKRMQSVPVK